MGKGGTGGKSECTLMPWAHFPHHPIQFISYAFHASYGTELSVLDDAVLAQQSSLVHLGRAELFPQATALNPHADGRHRALCRTGGGGIACERGEHSSSSTGPLPQTSPLTCSLWCDNAALRKTPCQEKCANST